jgi:DNA-binding HxlR family transcriptional regulator
MRYLSVKNMQNFHHNDFCPVRDILNHLSTKWATLILITLNANGVMRYNDIFKSIGDISQRMLASTLHNLTEDGLVQRVVYPEVPPKVEYMLTPLGKSLVPYVQNIIDWALQHRHEVLDGRK